MKYMPKKAVYSCSRTAKFKATLNFLCSYTLYVVIVLLYFYFLTRKKQSYLAKLVLQPETNFWEPWAGGIRLLVLMTMGCRTIWGILGLMPTCVWITCTLGCGNWGLTRGLCCLRAPAWALTGLTTWLGILTWAPGTTGVWLLNGDPCPRPGDVSIWVGWLKI